jgi:hypothetical protein
MASSEGRSISLTLPRRWVGDLLHFASKVPTVPVQRRMNVTRVREARSALADPICWCAIFAKAYGLTAAEFPELRRAYLPFPWARLYEHPFSVASLAVEREYQGEKAVFFAHVRGPEKHSLRDLADRISLLKEAPLERFGLFRRALQISRLPWPVRWFVWWLGLNSSGAKRAKRMGTFGISVYSGLGAESLHPLSPLTTVLNYGVVGRDGTVPVRVIYDHRVMDGSTVARALQRLEAILNNEIVAELQHAERRAA